MIKYHVIFESLYCKMLFLLEQVNCLNFWLILKEMSKNEI